MKGGRDSGPALCNCCWASSVNCKSGLCSAKKNTALCRAICEARGTAREARSAPSMTKWAKFAHFKEFSFPGHTTHTTYTSCAFHSGPTESPDFPPDSVFPRYDTTASWAVTGSCAPLLIPTAQTLAYRAFPARSRGVHISHRTHSALPFHSQPALGSLHASRNSCLPSTINTEWTRPSVYLVLLPVPTRGNHLRHALPTPLFPCFPLLL